MSQSDGGNEDSASPNNYPGGPGAGQPDAGGPGNYGPGAANDQGSWQSPAQPDYDSQPPQQSSTWGGGAEQYPMAQGGSGQVPPAGSHYAQTGDGGGGKKGPVALMIGIGAAVVLILVAAIVFLLLNMGDDDEDQGSDPEEAAEEDDGEDEAEVPEGIDTTDPAAVVEGYFDALSQGDFETASSLWDSSPQSAGISAEVLEVSLGLASIDSVELSEAHGDEYTSAVQATMTTGSETTHFDVRLISSFDSEDWQIMTHTLTDTIGLPDATGPLSPTLNGVEVKGSVEVLAGLNYAVGFSDDAYIFDGLEDGTISVGGDDYVFLSSSDMALSDEALETWREMVRESVEECVESAELDAGCGLALSEIQEGVELIDGTVERSMPTATVEELNNLEPRFNYQQPHLVEAQYFTGSIGVFVDGVEDGVEDRYELLWGDGGSLGEPIVNFTEDEPEVIWE